LRAASLQKHGRHLSTRHRYNSTALSQSATNGWLPLASIGVARISSFN